MSDIRVESVGEFVRITDLRASGWPGAEIFVRKEDIKELIALLSNLTYDDASGSMKVNGNEFEAQRKESAPT